MGQGWGPEYPRVLADVNGDKIQDIVGFGIHGTWLAIAPPSNSVIFALKDFGYETGWRTDLHVRAMGDVNADGMDDIVGFGNDGVFRALSTGAAFGSVDYVVADFGYNQGWRNDKHVRLLADINGDKRKDIVAFGEHGVWVSVATSKAGDFSAPFFAVGDFGYLQGWRNDRHIRTTADLNGDTLQDIIGFGEHGVWVALANGTGFDSPQLVLTEFAISAGGWQITRHPRIMADIDNDTRDDIIGFGNDGVWISRSLGGGFTAPQLVIQDFGYNDGWRVELHPRYIADLNADGYKDIVGYGQESVYRSLNGPNGFAGIRGVLRALVAAEFPYSLTDPGFAPRYVGDVTGDGMADLVAFGESHVWVAKSSDQPPFAPPNAPTNLRIESTTETSMVVAWNDNSTDERQFFTYFGEPNLLSRTVRPPNTQTATYTNLEPDTRYCFTVEAESIWGVSGTPSSVCGRTKPEPEPTPTPTPEPFGFSRIDVFNCNSEQRAVTAWTFNHSTNTWTQHGTVPSMWANGSCPAQSVPFKVTLPNLQAVTFVAVDTGLPGCGQNNPQVPFCQRSKLQLFGKATGPVLPHTVN